MSLCSRRYLEKLIVTISMFIVLVVSFEFKTLASETDETSSFVEIVSEQSVLYVCVNDVPASLKNLSASIFEPQYSQALKAEKLRALEFPGIKYFAQLESKSSFEWLPDLLSSLKTLNDQLPNHENDVDTLSRLFAGELCIAVDSYNGQYFFVARFESNPEVFDWSREFKAVADGKPNLRVVHDTAIFSLEPRMDAFVLSDFVYVVAGWNEGNDEYLHRMLARIAGEDNSFSPLSSARWFMRCQKSLSRNRNYDKAETASVACRIKELFHLLDEPPGFRKQKDRFPDFTDAFAGLVTLASGDNHYTYQSVYTLLSPLPPDVKAALDSMNGLDLSKTRLIPADAALVSFASYRPNVAVNKLINATFWAGDELNLWVWKRLTDPARPSNKQDHFYREASKAENPLVRIVEAVGQGEIGRVRYYLGESDQDFQLLDAIFCDRDIAVSEDEAFESFQVLRIPTGRLLINTNALDNGKLPEDWQTRMSDGDLPFRSFNFEEQMGMGLGEHGKVVLVAVATEEAYYFSQWPPFLPVTFFVDLFSSHWRKSYLYRERRQTNGSHPYWLEGHYDYAERTFFTRSMQAALAAFADLSDTGFINSRKNSETVVADAMFVGRETIEYYGAYFTFAREKKE